MLVLATLLPSPNGAVAEDDDGAPAPATTAPPNGVVAPPVPGAAPGVDVDGDLEALTQDFGPALGDRWAGGWANQDGTITVAVTDKVLPDNDPLLLPFTTHPKVRIVTREHSTKRLRTTLETVVDRLNALLPSEGNPYDAGATHRGNIVEVTVDEKYENKRERIEAALADELAAGRVSITYATTPEEVEGCGTRTACVSPFRGGLLTTTSAGNACTLGFVVRTYHGIRRHTTAGHCPSATWSHGGRSIGPTIWNPYNGAVGNHDVQIIRQQNQGEPAPSNWVYRNSGTVAITTKITDPNSSLEGNNLCTEGWATGGTSCGPLGKWNAEWEGRCCFGKVDVNTCKGDSGAPVVNNGTNRAYGIYMGMYFILGTGGADCGTMGSAFTWVPYAETATGDNVLLTPTSEALGYGQRMNAGYALVSPNGVYNLQMQGDGNLVLYNCCGTYLWEATTWGNPGAFAVMQTDGNFVIYSATGTPLWNRPWTNRVSGSYLQLQDDGNLVIYAPGRTWKWHRWCNCTGT